MEAFGYEKREQLVDRVEDARDSQEEAKEQFKTALEQFASVVNFSGGELEVVYNKLDRELKSSESKASAVTDRIAAVEEVAARLFDEWEGELDDYSSERLRASSEQKLRQTRSRYTQLIGVMKRAEGKIEPVLKVFRDNVLYIKHNLNA